MRTLQVLFVVVAVAAGSGDALQEKASAQPEEVTFAVLRRDGVIVPFARWHGRRWSTPWPAGLAGRTLPITVEAIPPFWWGGDPPDATWHTRLLDGKEGTLTVQAPALYGVHCARRLGLRTDYRATELLPAPTVQPFPKDGLVLSEAATLEPVEIVPPSAAERPALAVSLLDQFDAAEDQSMAGIAMAHGWRHPLQRNERHRIAVRLESWYRVTLGEGATASYVEAVRSYPVREEDEGCGLETFFSGWVVHRAGDASPRASLRAKVTYCDRVGATYMLPLGLFRVADRVYWLYQLSGWEDEWYAVTEVGERGARVVAEYHAGGLNSCG